MKLCRLSLSVKQIGTYSSTLYTSYLDKQAVDIESLFGELAAAASWSVFAS